MGPILFHFRIPSRAALGALQIAAFVASATALGHASAVALPSLAPIVSRWIWTNVCAIPPFYSIAFFAALSSHTTWLLSMLLPLFCGPATLRLAIAALCLWTLASSVVATSLLTALGMHVAGSIVVATAPLTAALAVSLAATWLLSVLLPLFCGPATRRLAIAAFCVCCRVARAAVFAAVSAFFWAIFLTLLPLCLCQIAVHLTIALARVVPSVICYTPRVFARAVALLLDEPLAALCAVISFPVLLVADLLSVVLSFPVRLLDQWCWRWIAFLPPTSLEF